jgi:hypothetical protein
LAGRRRAERPNSASWLQSPIPGRTVTAMTGERILVVEDDDRIGSALLRALEGCAYDARWVHNGRDAIDATRSSTSSSVSTPAPSTTSPSRSSSLS